MMSLCLSEIVLKQNAPNLVFQVLLQTCRGILRCCIDVMQTNGKKRLEIQVEKWTECCDRKRDFHPSSEDVFEDRPEAFLMWP